MASMEIDTVTPETVSSRRTYILDISIIASEGSITLEEPLNLTDVYAFSVGQGASGTNIELTRASERQWEGVGEVELPADNLEVLCILKSEEGADIGMAHIPYIGIFDDEEKSDRKPKCIRYAKTSVSCDTGHSLDFIWRAMQPTSTEATMADDDTPSDDTCEGSSEGAAKALSKIMLGLAHHMRARNWLAGDLSDPEDAVTLAKMAAELLSEGDAEFSVAMNFLEGSSSAKSEEGDCTMDIDLAIGLIAQNAESSSSASKGNGSTVNIKVTGAVDDLQSDTPFDATDSSALENLPEEGPVVTFNVREEASEAIVLVAGLEEPLRILLPHFTLEKAKGYGAELKRQLDIRATRIRGEDGEGGSAIAVEGGDKVVREILRALWVEVVKPILDMLGIPRSDASTSMRLPRIWWCQTSILSSLPIHAAGIYGEPDFECLSDYAVSSYTPTVKTLIDQVKNEFRVSKTTSGLFLMSQPSPSAEDQVMRSSAEVQAIHEKAVNERIRVVAMEGGDINPLQCLDCMEDFSSIHWAYDVSQVVEDPMILFHRGFLPLSAIRKKTLKQADLAFLSTRHFSTKKEGSASEGTHLAAGFLAAGYRRVVTTMWAVADGHPPGLTDEFYDYLWSRGDGPGRGGAFDGTLSAYALHHAIQKLRLRLEESGGDLMSWIPYVHFGN
ncbi:hypothetical protein FA13DRAFT_1800258 [Coprinellus micaceus]|uniref:CHAT domain-containing protein n=1 Tax=Coprinellus micaceus TaxID=71717 RepID=A0A4Y7SGX1_COPMI|nr:hypothetical protein FA13DRAFT_1800258 [Coprinellus micaceus]